MFSDYKLQLDELSASDQHPILENHLLDHSNDIANDRSLKYLDSIIFELEMNLDDESMDLDAISGLLDIICNSIAGLIDITTIINLQLCLCFIDYFPYFPLNISKILKNIV